ncbi:MAG: hypothetical protein IK990_16385 [Ruminiclostridium sp.]|nr:hypothetical protein [Ruminiclostridium sp.]
MQEVKVIVNGGIISDAELQMYIARGRRNQPRNELVGLTVTLDGDYADIDYKYAQPLMPQRFSLCGDMIIENFENLNKAKQAEYLDRVPNEV